MKKDRYCRHCKNVLKTKQEWCDKPKCQEAKRKYQKKNREKNQKYPKRHKKVQLKKGLCHKCGKRPIAKGNWIHCEKCKAQNDKIDLGMLDEYFC